jgi:hypothetical protein
MTKSILKLTESWSRKIEAEMQKVSILLHGDTITEELKRKAA